MRRIDWMALTVVWVIAGAMPVSAADCIVANTEGVELVGTIDALRGGLRALIVRPKIAVCLTGPAPADAISETDAVQVYSNEDSVMTKMMGMIGTEVRLKGRMFAPFAQVHRAAIIMDVSTAQPN